LVGERKKGGRRRTKKGAVRKLVRSALRNPSSRGEKERIHVGPWLEQRSSGRVISLKGLPSSFGGKEKKMFSKKKERSSRVEGKKRKRLSIPFLSTWSSLILRPTIRAGGEGGNFKKVVEEPLKGRSSPWGKSLLWESNHHGERGVSRSETQKRKGE